jgi:hypothetical protein
MKQRKIAMPADLLSRPLIDIAADLLLNGLPAA